MWRLPLILDALLLCLNLPLFARKHLLLGLNLLLKLLHVFLRSGDGFQISHGGAVLSMPWSRDVGKGGFNDCIQNTLAMSTFRGTHTMISSVGENVRMLGCSGADLEKPQRCEQPRKGAVLRRAAVVVIMFRHRLFIAF